MDTGADTHSDPDELVVEADGETLGEAKWNAMKALEPRFPGITAECVRFEVVEVGDDAPARVRGRVDEDAWRSAAGEELPEDPAERLRAVVTRVVQALGMRAALRGGSERKQVVVDAAGYRDRRAATLHRAADRAVSDAISSGRSVSLEPMRALERKVVHMYLRDRTDVETHSEGDEPDRRLVITPVRRDS
jgi:hypothetical protein